MDCPPALERFYSLPPQERKGFLEEAICRVHTYHYERNVAYRRTMLGRGVGPQITVRQFPRLLRLAALTFKEYIEQIGPFPQNHPAAFDQWLQDQVSISLGEGLAALRPHYSSIEDLLLAVEARYANLGIEIVTSSGTSGRTSFVPRDRETLSLAVSAFFTGIRRTWGIGNDVTLIFMMPRQTRVAMARVAQLGTRETGWSGHNPVYYTLPFPASPDQIRIRTGRLYQPGYKGMIEQRLLNPGMNLAYAQFALPGMLALTRRRLQECLRAGQPLMLLGGMSQLHALVEKGYSGEPCALPLGSRVATGGGMKENTPYTPAQIRNDLQKAFPGTPVSDVYGMAEANWAAFECPAGNYHIPSWVYAVVSDDEDQIRTGPEVTGLLAFFDPLGGGQLVPPFFQTADRVRLFGSPVYDPRAACPCGEQTAYMQGPIQRVDLIEEAGCAGQL